MGFWLGGRQLRWRRRVKKGDHHHNSVFFLIFHLMHTVFGNVHMLRMSLWCVAALLPTLTKKHAVYCITHIHPVMKNILPASCVDSTLLCTVSSSPCAPCCCYTQLKNLCLCACVPLFVPLCPSPIFLGSYIQLRFSPCTLCRGTIISLAPHH